MRFKSTMDSKKLVDEYLARMPETIFYPSDYTFGSRFAAYHRHPVKRRLVLIADDILDRFETDNFMDKPLPKARAILKNLTAMLKMKNTLSLYKDFYKQNNIADKALISTQRWGASWHNGLSGRTARQFVDNLSGELYLHEKL